MTLAIKRAAQVNFVSVDDIANFVKKKFDNKLKNLNKDVMLNKIEINYQTKLKHYQQKY